MELNAVPAGTVAGHQGPLPTLSAAESQLRQTIQAQFQLPDELHYRETANENGQAFLWSQAVELSALARGLAVKRTTYQPLWVTARKSLDTYWSDGTPGGYAVLPGQNTNPERFYDDNVWVAWAMLDAYKVTHDRLDLDHAKSAFRFVESGKDDQLGGGIFWQEKKKTEKNACINAPAAAVAFQFYEITHEARYLELGNELVTWTQKTLQDSDGLIMDNISISGKVEKTKWTYNTACYIRALIERYQLTHQESDKAEALRVLDAADRKWIDPDTHLLRDPGPFGQHLLDAQFEAAVAFNRPDMAKSATETILAVVSFCPDDAKLYGEYWNRKTRPKDTRNLRNIASVLRAALSAWKASTAQ